MCILDEHCDEGELCLESGLCTKHAFAVNDRCSASVSCPKPAKGTELVCYNGLCREACPFETMTCRPIAEDKFILLTLSGNPSDCYEGWGHYPLKGDCKKVIEAGQKCPPAMEGLRLPCEPRAVCLNKACRPLCSKDHGCPTGLTCYYAAAHVDGETQGLKGSFGVCYSDIDASTYGLYKDPFPKWARAILALGLIAIFLIGSIQLFKYLRRKRKGKKDKDEDKDEDENQDENSESEIDEKIE